MQTIDITTWKDFKAELEQLYEETDKLRVERAPRLVSEPVFRGQTDANWTLFTSLEREVGSNISMLDYYRRILYPSLRMLKGVMSFDLPECPELNLSVRDLDVHFPLSDKLAMLRHHGFPSPLLDWTLSPLVAAYFAFSPVPSGGTQKVAIFCYREYFGEGKGYTGGKAHIKSLGTWAPVHGRHVRQQSQYTVAVRDQSNGGVEFCSHEDAITERPFPWLRFDEITKFTLPVALRGEVLRDLRRMNITEYSLFDTTDALVRTVARFAISKP